MHMKGMKKAEGRTKIQYKGADVRTGVGSEVGQYCPEPEPDLWMLCCYAGCYTV
jgi:hypothetical protein